jgi:ribosomal protein S21
MSTVVNAEVKKNSNENTVNLIRRFTKRVQSAGVLARVRSIRWSKRKPSRFKAKKSALVVLAKRKEYEWLKKLGKLPTK